MTIVTKLTMSGFKSFAKKTDLEFGKTFNCILGPNGSGKSNVMDALCFVLGKTSAKSMRAEKSANLIYNGGKKSGPAKHAEVSIFFDNSTKEFPLEEKEIKVSRIVKQDGQSDYRLNDKKMTRQQIIDILSTAKIDPDGHNIILQGDIVHFMDMKPLDRRLLIEEIAGISVFEDKKQKALSELGKVEEKLTEANIILTEREASLNELKKDRDQAKKYMELKDNIKNNKATFVFLQLEERRNRLKVIDEAIDIQRKEYNILKDRIDDVTKIVEKDKTELQDINTDLEKRGELDQINIRDSITNIKTDVVKAQSRIDVLKNEIKKIEDRKLQFKLTIDDNNKKIDALMKEKKQTEIEIKELTKKENNLTKTPSLDELKEKINELSSLKAKSSMEGHTDSSIELVSSIPGVYGTISDLGSVNPKYSLALEVTAGQKMRSVVTKDDMIAEECIKKLKEKREGVVTFLPLNRIQFKDITPDLKSLSRKDGVHGFAIDLIKYNSKYVNAFKHVFGNTLIVDDIGTARKIGIGRIRMVSLDGDLIEKNGAMVGGYRTKTKIGFKHQDIEEEIHRIEKEIDESQAPKFLQTEKTEVTAKIMQSNSLLGSIEAKINYLSNENQTIYKSFNELDKEKSDFTKEFDELNNVMKLKSVSLKNNEQKEKDFFAKQKELFARRNSLTESIEKNSKAISENMDRIRLVENKINNISIEKAGCVGTIAGLEKEFEEYKDGEIRKNVNIDKLKEEIKEYEILMIKLGNVNMKALEIYDKLAEEHIQLVEKTTKLKDEKLDVLDMITEVEKDKTRVFMKTYDSLNNRFKEIFSQLSTKGEASLMLENEEDPLAAGLDITVRIASKKYLDIRSLSGGEKTLAALAFIFSIQEYNPASFYILDEVDAALDKHNSEKLGKLFAQYSSRAQYIVISHNDAIISEADQIYGVSMQEGVSKVTSLRL